MESFAIGDRMIGSGNPPYVIAEIGSNHNGQMSLAKQLIDAAKDCGADAVKFQSWSESSLISGAEYKRNTAYQDKHRHFGSLKKMVEAYQLTPDQHVELAAYCKSKHITFLSSCFSEQEVDLLESLDVPCFKFASMDINYLGLLEYVAKKARPVIISTGMATLGEIERAVDLLVKNGASQVVILHCVSTYPTPPEALNLRNIITLREAFETPVGFSDHSAGTYAAVAAVSLGACVIEKHFTLDKTSPGWDHAISAEPPELAALVSECQKALVSLGSARIVVTDQEMVKRQSFRRSAVAKHAMGKGQVIMAADVDFKRPGTGIAPDELQYLVGRSVCRDLEEDEEIKWSDLQ